MAERDHPAGSTLVQGIALCARRAAVVLGLGMTLCGGALAAATTAGAAKNAQPAEAGGASVVYTIDAARSSAGFTMKATLHTVEGTSGALSGEFTRPESPGPTGFPVTGKIALTSRTLDTGNGSRDKKMRAESLAVNRFPEIVFAPRAARGKIASFAPGTTANFELEGELTIRDIKRPVTFAVTARFLDQGLTADGKATISFLDFGVPDPSNAILKVKPNIVLNVHIEARAR